MPPTTSFIKHPRGMESVTAAVVTSIKGAMTLLKQYPTAWMSTGGRQCPFWNTIVQEVDGELSIDQVFSEIEKVIRSFA